MRTYFLFLSLLSFFSFGYSQNLVTNPGFETNGQPNCSSWYDGCKQELTYLCDTLVPGNPCDISFAKDAPQGGGTWSLDATGIGNGFPATASTFITGQSGTNQYLFNIWMKDDGQAFGGASVRVLHKGSVMSEKSIQTAGMGWNFYSVKDTLKLDPTDTIEITLSAFAAGPSFGDIYFDEVEFILLDSLSAVSDLNISSNHVSVFPNPVIDFLTFKLEERNVEHTIKIYSVTGQWVQTVISSDQNIIVDLNGKESGIYFYKVERTKERRQVGAGKIVVE
ncbi:MAG TPA: T9SS type A sorting domain-containing protein [Saprospiraceae bacterium]|nr:T9SS type A sorting domain-containing protein [Saprospiraceae bacterium]